MKRGLPYGWWKNSDVWVTFVITLSFVFATPIILLIMWAWWY